MIFALIAITSEANLIAKQSNSNTNENLASTLVNNYIKKMDKVNDYEVDVNIKVDVEFINIKDRKAKLYYKKPDKYEIKSDDFALLPKNGAAMEYIKILKENHTAIYEAKEKAKGKELDKIKIIPTESQSDIILASIWIDAKANRLIKVEAFTKNSGSYLVELVYDKNPFDLVSKTIIEFDLKSFQMPAKMGDMKSFGKNDKKENTKGKIIMTYENYKISNNKGGKSK